MKIMINFFTQLMLEYKLLITLLIASRCVLCTTHFMNNDSSSDHHYHHHQDTNYHQQGNDDWDLVKYLRLNYSNYGNCEVACRNDPYCIKWQLTINDLSNRRMTDLNLPLTGVETHHHDLDCLLLSNTMVQVMDRLDGHIHNTASSSSFINEDPDPRHNNNKYINESIHTNCSSTGDDVGSHAPLMIEGTKVFPFNDRHRQQQQRRPLFHDNQSPIIDDDHDDDDGRAKLIRLLKGPVAMDISSVVNFDEHMVRGCSFVYHLHVALAMAS